MTTGICYFSGTRDTYGTPLLSSDWGEFTFFIEVDDQHVTRQVNWYENGMILRYDRSHWCDRFGFMFVGTFSRKQKAERGMQPIEQKEFERVWKRALAVDSSWKEQQVHAMMHEWGTWQDRVTVSRA